MPGGRFPQANRRSPTGPGPAKSCEKRSGGFPTPTLTGGLKVPPPIRPTPAPPGPSEGNRGEEGDKNVPPPCAPCFLRSSPTGPGPAKSCEKRSGGFPTPTLTGGLKVPPPIRATPAPPGPSEGNRGEEGGKNVPPPGGKFSQKRGFSYPRTVAATRIPPLIRRQESRRSGRLSNRREIPLRNW